MNEVLTAIFNVILTVKQYALIPVLGNRECQ